MIVMENDSSHDGESGLAGRTDIDMLVEISRNNALSSANLIQQVGLLAQQGNENTLAINRNTQEIDDLRNRFTNHEQNETLSDEQRGDVRDAINDRIYKLLGLKKRNGRLTAESRRISNVYSGKFHSAIYRDLYHKFKVTKYSKIRAIDFEEAMRLIENWEPRKGIQDLRVDAEEAWMEKNPGKSLRDYLGVTFISSDLSE